MQLNLSSGQRDPGADRVQAGRDHGAEEVRRAGRLEQGGAHHPECFQEVRAACDFEIEARYSETWSASG